MLPMAAAMMPTARLAPVLVARVGSRVVCVTGLVLISGARTVLAQLETVQLGGWLLVGGLVPLGIGMGAAMTPATSAITEALPASQQGVGSAMNDLARELGGALGIAVVGMLPRLRLPRPLLVACRQPAERAGRPGEGNRWRWPPTSAVPWPTQDGQPSPTACTPGCWSVPRTALAAAVLVALLLPRSNADGDADTDPTDALDRDTQLVGSAAS